MTRFLGEHKKKLALLLSVILIGTAVVGGTLAYVITRSPSLLNTFISEQSADLVISKTVSHSLGDSYVIPEDKEFKFTVTMGEAYAGKEISVLEGQGMEPETVKVKSDGTFDIFLKPGRAVSLQDLLVGTEVQVMEIFTPEDIAGETGFTLKGDNPKVITIARGENRAEFVNEYKPAPVPEGQLTIGGTKILKERDWNLNESFTFVLEKFIPGEDGAEGSWKELGKASATFEMVEKDGKWVPRDGYNKFSFDSLLFDEEEGGFDRAGTHSFRVYEEKGDDPTIQYDTGLYCFDVEVTDKEMDGVLEIDGVTGYGENVKVSEDQDEVNIGFVNTYTEVEEDSDSVRIDILKKVDTTAGEKSPAGYVFYLYEYEGYSSESEPVAVSAPTSESGETYIGLTYTNAGIYRYLLREAIPKAEDRIPGIVYDETVHLITVEVEFNTANKLEASIESKPMKVDPLGDSEDNTVYYEPAPASQSDSNDNGGNTPVENDDGIPEISADGGQLLSAGSAKTKTGLATNSADGVNVVDAGEDDTQGNDYQWLDPKSDNVCQVVFTNRYEPTAATGPVISGTKKLTGEGRELKAEEFSFRMSSTDKHSSFKPITVTNDEDGFFIFDLIDVDFSRIGVFEYVIEEVDGELGGIVYDTAKYYVTVTVTDNGGELNAETVIKDGFGNTVENGELLFTNSYEPAPAVVILTAKKYLNGELANTDHDFTFAIHKADSAMNKDQLVSEASNDKDGLITFKALQLTETGTHYYVVEEVKGEEAGMTYDTTAYYVAVTVTDNGEGQLESSTAIIKKGGATPLAGDMEFRNTYVKPEVTPTPTPTPTPGPGDPTPTPGGTAVPGATPDSDVPPTGDDNNIALYVTVMVASVAAIAGLLIAGRRQKGSGGRKKHKKHRRR